MRNPRLLVLGLAPVLISVVIWLLQSLAMQVLSKQYREVGYIEYGWFTRPEGSRAQFGIVWAPLLASVLVLPTYGRRASGFAAGSDYEWFRILIWLELTVCFLVLAVRIALICIQGYALIFI